MGRVDRGRVRDKLLQIEARGEKLTGGEILRNLNICCHI